MNNKSNQCHAGKALKKPAIWLYCVIICVALLASFCLGWYVDSVVNADNKIQASVFDMTAQISIADGTKVDVTADKDGALTATLTAGQTYTVDLGCGNKTTGHGCCAVSVNGENYQTVTFGKCGVANCSNCGSRQSLQFTVTIPAGENVQIKLVPIWGVKALAAGSQEIAASAAIPYAD